MKHETPFFLLAAFWSEIVAPVFLGVSFWAAVVVALLVIARGGLMPVDQKIENVVLRNLIAAADRELAAIEGSP
jgi:hypothetical protein